MDQIAVSKDSIDYSRLESLAYLYNCQLSGSDESYYILEGQEEAILELSQALSREIKEWEN